MALILQRGRRARSDSKQPGLKWPRRQRGAMETKTFDAEPGGGLELTELPPYAAMLDAYHRAYGPELRAIVAALPLGPGDRVLDVACGDGYYCDLLAERAGSVLGVDLSTAYLDLARARRAGSPHAGRVAFQQAAVEALGVGVGQFDLAWCAHSLFSLPDPLEALRTMAEAVRPGGHIAILENDNLHHMIMPWPAELELAVRQAQLQALAERTSPRELQKFYIGRDLGGIMGQAGLEVVSRRTFVLERRAPLSDDEAFVLREHIAELRAVIDPHLDAATRTALDLLIEPDSERYLFRQPDFHLAQLEMLAVGRRP